ncbi:MAG: hypothetical protein KIS66_09670 [Fimbriimonadaceae bacterium]|nr:hypothetical protein [Fimbriimonadaceae bacterium]
MDNEKIVRMVVEWNETALDAVPVSFVNHAEVRMGADHVQVMFGFRSDFGVTLDDHGAKAVAKPCGVLCMTEEHALRLAHALTNTVLGRKKLTEAEK